VEGLVKAYKRVRLTIDEIAIGSKICIICLYLGNVNGQEKLTLFSGSQHAHTIKYYI
jgi:hypothetical protein